jgi:5-methylcytosine-specific restriction endonuclease McrA
MRTHLRSTLYCCADCKHLFQVSGWYCVGCKAKNTRPPFDLFLTPERRAAVDAHNEAFSREHEVCRSDLLDRAGRTLECECADCRESRGLPRKRDARYPWVESNGRSDEYRKHFGAVMERDEWTCQICLLPLDRDAMPFDDKAPVLDHEKRVRDGGGEGMNNLRAAHRWCNAMREFGGIGRFDFEVYEMARNRFGVEE